MEEESVEVILVDDEEEETYQGQIGYLQICSQKVTGYGRIDWYVRII